MNADELRLMLTTDYVHFFRDSRDDTKQNYMMFDFDGAGCEVSKIVGFGNLIGVMFDRSFEEYFDLDNDVEMFDSYNNIQKTKDPQKLTVTIN